MSSFGNGLNKQQLESAMARLNDRLAEVELKDHERIFTKPSPITTPAPVMRAEVKPVPQVLEDQDMRRRLAYLESENARLRSAAQARADKAIARRKWNFAEVPVNGHIEVTPDEAKELRSHLQSAKASYLKGQDTVWTVRAIGDKVMAFRLK